MTAVTVSRSLAEVIIDTLPSACNHLNLGLLCRLEEDLKRIPEYVDEYQFPSGEIVITKVIRDGCLLHVINCLHLLAGVDQDGFLQRLRVDRRLLVETLLLHDIGKIQPQLAVGDRVIPGQVFEDGREHARRSAVYASRYWPPWPERDILIFHHHHLEAGLPFTFPQALLPPWRLVCLLDGLSAAITRRGARVTMRVQGSQVVVQEINCHPGYCGTRVVDIGEGQPERTRGTGKEEQLLIR